VTRLPRAVAALTVASLVLVACGGSDDPVAAPDDPSTEASDDTGDAADTAGSTSNGDAPDATVDPNLPAEMLPYVGPVEVIGDPLPRLADESNDPAVGMPAPILVGQDYAGSAVRIDAAAAGPTMVVFLAHWCPHCNAEVPRLNELRDAGRFPDDLNIVAVSTSINPTLPNFPPDEWLEDVDWTYPAMADGADVETESFIAAAAFGVSGFPFVTIIDADGNVTDRWSGEREPDQVIAELDAALG
jgi:thiol-disulfide isomerase/thioredoxin